MGMFGVVRFSKRGPSVSVGYATRFGGGSRRQKSAEDLKGIGILIAGFPVICILGFAYKFTGWLGVGVVGAMMIAAVWYIVDTFEAIKAKTMTDAQLKKRIWICGASIAAFMVAFGFVVLWARSVPEPQAVAGQKSPAIEQAERDRAKQPNDWSAYQAKLKSREEIIKQKAEIAQSNRKLNEELRAYCTEDPTRCTNLAEAEAEVSNAV